MTLTRSMIQVIAANAETPAMTAAEIKHMANYLWKLECQRITNDDSFFANTKWRKNKDFIKHSKPNPKGSLLLGVSRCHELYD